jgi:hypothetical protein
MPIINVNGAKINYSQLGYKGEGEAEELVMVHGLAANMAFWLGDYAKHFSQKFRVTLSTTDDNDAGHKKFQSSISNIINDTIASNLGDKKTVLYIGETVENIRNAGIIKDQYETILHLITVNKKVEKMRFIQEFKNFFCAHNPKHIKPAKCI